MNTFKPYTDKSSVLKKSTRYVQGGVATVKQKNVGWWEREPAFNKFADDDIIIYRLPMIYERRPDLLAYDLYQDDSLEWVILQFCNIIDINEEFVQGAKLRLPSKPRLLSRMLIKVVVYPDV